MMKSVKVRDYMATRLVTFHENTNVVQAMDQFLKHSISGAPVVDDEGNLVGILSEVDLMQVVVQDSYYDESIGIVADYMRADVDTIEVDMDIYTLAEKFIKEHRRRYPVTSKGKLVGQISRRDVLRAAEEFLRKEKKRKPRRATLR
ncbi:MAG: CBS domain-containing protein [Pseudomonadales bacterium]|nr:CBS domain-containing protein [Pseudomonadales bacterium]